MTFRTIVLFLVLLLPLGSFAQWYPTNGPAGGTPTAFGVVRTGSNTTIFAGTANGVYRSSDDGVDWSASGLKGVSISHLLQYGNTDTIFATTDRFAHRSTDGGRSWSQVFSAASGMITDIAQHGSVLYIALAPDVDSIGSGLYSSSNGGTTWAKSTAVAQFNDIQSVVGVGNHVIAATRNHGLFSSTNDGVAWSKVSYPDLTASYTLSASNGVLYSGTAGGVVVSSDEGIGWTKKVNGGLDTLDRVVQLAINGRTLLAVVQGRAYLSTDSGTTWQGSFFAASTTSSSFAAVAYTGTSYLSGNDAGITRSLDGATWQLSNAGETGSNITSLIEHNGTLYALTTLGGVTQSTDQGNTWLTPGTADLQDQVLFALDTSDGNVYAYGFGLWVRNGGAWQKVSDVHIPALVIHNGVFLYAAADGSVIRSSDHGTTWDTSNTGRSQEINQTSFLLKSGNNIVDVNEFLDPSHKGSSTVFYLSSDDGRSWHPTDSINRRLGPTDAADGSQETLISTSSGSEVFASRDRGVHWSLLSSFPSPGEYVRLLRPLRGGFIAFLTNFFGSVATGLYHSSTGSNWASINQGLDLNALVTSFADDQQYLYSGIENSGVWRRSLSSVGVARNVAQRSSLGVFPNPTATSGNVTFALPVQGHVTLSLYDTRGVAIAVLANGEMNAGEYLIPLRANELANGSYRLVLETAGAESAMQVLIQH